MVFWDVTFPTFDIFLFDQWRILHRDVQVPRQAVAIIRTYFSDYCKILGISLKDRRGWWKITLISWFYWNYKMYFLLKLWWYIMILSNSSLTYTFYSILLYLLKYQFNYHFGTSKYWDLVILVSIFKMSNLDPNNLSSIRGLGSSIRLS